MFLSSPSVPVLKRLFLLIGDAGCFEQRPELGLLEDPDLKEPSRDGTMCRCGRRDELPEPERLDSSDKVDLTEKYADFVVFKDGAPPADASDVLD